MKNDDLIRVRHMYEAALEALRFTDRKRKEDLHADRMLLLSVVKSIEILGEAASRVSPEGREALPQVPWKDIVTMRNRLIHVYFDIDVNVVWDTVTSDLPGLVPVLKDFLN